jgi:hypothetical protein
MAPSLSCFWDFIDSGQGVVRPGCVSGPWFSSDTERAVLWGPWRRPGMAFPGREIRSHWGTECLYLVVPAVGKCCICSPQPHTQSQNKIPLSPASQVRL